MIEATGILFHLFFTPTFLQSTISHPLPTSNPFPIHLQVQNGKFQKYDHGFIMNMIRYGSTRSVFFWPWLYFGLGCTLFLTFHHHQANYHHGPIIFILTFCHCTWDQCSPHPRKMISRFQSMKAFGPFLGLVISLFIFLGYNEAGFNFSLGYKVTFWGSPQSSPCIQFEASQTWP
jgi:hypothetical protein